MLELTYKVCLCTHCLFSYSYLHRPAPVAATAANANIIYSIILYFIIIISSFHI